MANLEDEPETAVPRGGTPRILPAAASPDVPAGHLAPGAPPEPGLDVDAGLVPAKAARPTKLVRPEFEAREVGENNVLRGCPPAPPLRHVDGGLTANERAVADRKIQHPGESHSDIGHMLGLSTNTVQRSLDRPQVKMYMSTWLDAAGADLKASAKVIADAHQADKITHYAFRGVVGDSKVDVDHVTRLEAARLNMQAHGVLDEARGAGLNIYYNLTDAQLRAIEEGRNRLEDFIAEPPK